MPTTADSGDRNFAIDGQVFAAPELAPGLYVVATPIGNLADITLRALRTLAAADVVLCEDTRLSARLLDHYAIRTRRTALHQHNEAARLEPLLERIAAGERLALISDAGTPLLSDPGFPLVRAARAAGLPVFAVPGPSALLAALASAGLPTDSFTFAGFLPPKAGARVTALADLATRRETLVFYESPRRLAATLAAMRDAFGQERLAAVALELTKKFERLAASPLEELAASFADGETKGEAVILVAGASEPEPDVTAWHAALETAMAEMPLRAAVDDIAATYGIKRKTVYDAALAKKSEKT